MKNLILNTRKAELNAQVKQALAEKLGTRTERLNAEVVYNYYNLALGLNSLKRINLVRDFNGQQIIELDKNVEDGSYTVKYLNGETANIPANESISVFKKNTVSLKVKANDKDNSVNYTIALIKKTKFGNNQYLLKDGTFNTSLANRYSFKSMKGAENLINTLVKAKKAKPFTLKVVSSEVN